MEPLILFSLSLLIGVIVPFAIPRLSGLISGRRESVITKSIVRDELPLRKSISIYGSPTRIFLPNLLSKWPWTRRINPNYAMVKEEADARIANFQAFGPKAQDALIRCNCALLACLAYPTASKEHMRAACDLFHLLFVIDEYSDRSKPSAVRMQKDVIMDAFRNPHTPRPKDEWIGGEVARQFWERAIQSATPVSQKRFIQKTEEYLESVLQEAIDKNEHLIRDINDYIKARRLTGAVQVSFCIVELGLDIPDEVMSHPIVQEMVLAAVDLIVFSNDIFSYNLEQRRGDDLHNMITCVMSEYNTDVNGAVLWVEDFLSGAEERFRTAWASLPVWEEPLNSQVREYCDGLGQWVRANDDWSFEGQRYFGDKGLEVKAKRWISLLPKDRASESEIGPVHIDSSLLL